MAIQLAEATLSEDQRANGWQVGYSEREERAYFFNTVMGKTQWESPTTTENGVTSVDVSDGPSTGPTKEQKPHLPRFPAGLRPPPTPSAAPHTKDVFKFPDTAPATVAGHSEPNGVKRKLNMVSTCDFV